MSRRIFITGAGGFVGRAMVRAGAVALPREAAPERLESERGHGPASLVHLAWPGLVGGASRAGASGPGEETVGRFMDWSMRLRRTCAELDIDFIGVGTGVEPHADAMGEPYSTYARRKVALRKALEAEGPLAWVRLHFMFGPGESPERLLPRAIRAAVEGRPLISGAHERRRCWLAVDDAAAALAGFANMPLAGGFDVCGRKAISFDELFDLVSQACGRPLRLEAATSPVADANVPVIAPENLAPNLPPDAGARANLLARLKEYAVLIAGVGAR